MFYLDENMRYWVYNKIEAWIKVQKLKINKVDWEEMYNMYNSSNSCCKSSLFHAA